MSKSVVATNGAAKLHQQVTSIWVVVIDLMTVIFQTSRMRIVGSALVLKSPFG